MSAHTPGPWQFIDILGACVVRAGQREVLAYRHSPDAENKANAHLIAAAPELLASAHAAMAWWKEHEFDTTGERGEWNLFDSEPEFLTAARAAILKATGNQP